MFGENDPPRKDSSVTSFGGVRFSTTGKTSINPNFPIQQGGGGIIPRTGSAASIAASDSLTSGSNPRKNIPIGKNPANPTHRIIEAEQVYKTS
jgi:hypothetical protein